jgi:N6-adenosine-specific RNA methylase IME4
LLKLNIEQIADNPSFIFLWVGSEHLDDGRELFKKWGYKRCEDVVWIKTNKKNKDIKQSSSSDKSILQRVKEHCLVGLKGDIKKASDTSFIHANIDIDVIVDEEPEPGSLKKPEEIYDIIERFCLGRKRLELFGENHNIRGGWLTIGKLINETKFIEEEYNSWFVGDPNSKTFKSYRLT